MNELPTIKGLMKKHYPSNKLEGYHSGGKGRIFFMNEIMSMLLAHEQHAKEMLKFDKKGDVIDDAFYYEYWRGRLEALQALKGEVKK